MHVHKEGGVVERHFYIANLVSSLRFPLPKFVIRVLADFDIAPSQLLPNSWRILTTFYIGCRRARVDVTSRIFRLFYRLKTNEGW